MLTFNFEHKAPDRVRLTLRNDGVRTKLTLPARATKEEFAAATSLSERKSDTYNAKMLRKRLASYSEWLRRTYEGLIQEGRVREDVRTIRDMFAAQFGVSVPGSCCAAAPKKLGDFVPFYRKCMDGKATKGTRGVYKHTLDRMMLFDPNLADKGFADIDLKWLRGFEDFCARTASVNARSIHLRNIRAVFNAALDEELTQCYPFRRFKIRTEPTRKRSLDADALRRIFSYPAEDYALFYRDMFALSFMLCGINAADLYGLTEITAEGRVEYDRAKTHKHYSIKVEPEAREIIDRWRGRKALLCIADRWGDHRNFTHQCNNALQSLGEVRRTGRGGRKDIVPEWPELSMYWARHSWATVAFTDCDVPKDIVSQALGHSLGSDVTEIYLRRDPHKVDEANRRVLDWVLYGRR